VCNAATIFRVNETGGGSTKYIAVPTEIIWFVWNLDLSDEILLFMPYSS
jgi:hypothetical protein